MNCFQGNVFDHYFQSTVDGQNGQNAQQHVPVEKGVDMSLQMQDMGVIVIVAILFMNGGWVMEKNQYLNKTSAILSRVQVRISDILREGSRFI